MFYFVDGPCLMTVQHSEWLQGVNTNNKPKSTVFHPCSCEPALELASASGKSGPLTAVTDLFVGLKRAKIWMDCFRIILTQVWFFPGNDAVCCRWLLRDKLIQLISGSGVSESLLTLRTEFKLARKDTLCRHAPRQIITINFYYFITTSCHVHF